MRILILVTVLLALAFPASAASLSLYQALTSHAVDSTSTDVSISAGGTGPGINVIRVHPTEDIWIAVGISPQAAAVAVTTSVFVPADTTEYFYIRVTASISVIRDTTDGIVYVTEMEAKKIN